MKTILTLLSLLLFHTFLLAQHKIKSVNLIVSIEISYDFNHERVMHKIMPEATNEYSKEIAGLIAYNTGKKDANAIASFYFNKNDTSSVFYNYFLSKTEALQFLTDHQWQLVTVNNEISSTYENIQVIGELRSIPVSKIISKPVYYLRKEIP